MGFVAPSAANNLEIASLAKAIGGKPLNALTVQPTITVAHLANLGIRRISVVAHWRARFMGAAPMIAAQRTFAAFAQAGS